jgi:aryl-alcohol dehydrogenase-like predicted oxidoreductase
MPTGQKPRFADNPMAAGFVNERTLAVAREIQAVARELGRSPSQVAIAWVAQRDGVVIPIVGARRLSQIEDSLGALGLELPTEIAVRLEQASRIELGFPHDFLAAPFVRGMVHAGMYDAISNHRA